MSSQNNPERYWGGINSITINKFVYFIKGMTGFDSKISRIISMSSHEIALVKIDFTFLNGENNYALAA